MKSANTADTKSPEKLHSECQERLSFSVVNNATIHKLIDSIENLGCKIPKDFFSCRPCDAAISGGFSVPDKGSKLAYKPQIVICENKKIVAETIDQTIIHELVHAYDVCRANIEFTVCQQHACTEIRAAALSGECNMMDEFRRGSRTFLGGYQECVKRRAALSTSYNANCQGKHREVVESVFAKCFADTTPFEDKN